MRMFLIREGLVERKYLGNAGIPLPACENAVREHQDFGGLGRQVPTLLGKAIEHGLKRMPGGLGRKITAPVAAGLTVAHPGVGVKDANAAMVIWIDDELGKLRPHVVQAIDDRRNRPEVRLLADNRQAPMFDLSASVAVNFLPMVTKETELWGGLLSEEVVLDGVDPACVGVLVLVDQYDRIFFRQGRA